LVNGDFEGALENAVKAIAAPLQPPAIIVKTLLTVIETRLAELTGGPAAPARPAAAIPSATESPQIPADVGSGDVVNAPTRTAPIGRTWGHRRDEAPTVPLLAAASAPRPAAAVSVTAARSGSAAAIAPRKAVGAARDMIKAVGEQAETAVADVADTVGKIAGSARGARAARG